MPDQALSRAILWHRLYASAETLNELGRVLRQKKFDRYIGLDSRIEFFQKICRDSLRCTVPTEVLDEVKGLCRDAKDDQFLALCIAAHANFFVSSDQDLLVLDPWRGVAVRPRHSFWPNLESEESAMASSPTQIPYLEPWLRGTYTDVPAAGRAVLHALDLALDDLTKWTSGLTDSEIHAQPLGLTPLSFHLRHIARATDRILTYSEGGQLSAEQLAALKAEQRGSESLADLIAEVEASFSNAAERVRVLSTADFETFRGVGRKQLPTSIGGALIHVADHAQRHVGQVVTTAKVLKALRAE